MLNTSNSKPETISDYTIGARVRGYGVRGTCKGTIVGVSESPAAIQVKWDNEALMSAGAAGRWEEFYNVTLDN